MVTVIFKLHNSMTGHGVQILSTHLCTTPCQFHEEAYKTLGFLPLYHNNKALLKRKKESEQNQRFVLLPATKKK
jgi:hypothetical protein